MKSLTSWWLALILLLAPTLGGARTAHAQDYDEPGYEEDEDYVPEDAPEPGDYEEALASHGSWVDDDQYGRVWHPSVAVGWTPYVDGYWTYTPYGWTWVSYEPWSWTFHYGRWASLPLGWVWVPGYTWGPAWVDWYWGDGFVGWAPLSPFGHVTVINNFTFVHERDFCSTHLGHHVFSHNRVPDRVIQGWRHRDWRRERPPDVHRIERVSAQPVKRFDHKPPGTVAPRRFTRDRQLARPGQQPRSGGMRSPDHGSQDRGAIQRGEARVGHQGERGRQAYERPRGDRAPIQRDPGGGHEPRLSRPRATPDIGAARRAPQARYGQGHGTFERQAPPSPTMGSARPAPPAVPGGGHFGRPTSGAQGGHGGGSARFGGGGGGGGGGGSAPAGQSPHYRAGGHGGGGGRGGHGGRGHVR